MKSKIFSISLLLAVATPAASACGAFYSRVPDITYFACENDSRDRNREENLKLWQELTSPDIPLSDIEQAVYHDDYDEVSTNIWSSHDGDSDNLFYRYISRIDPELADFLLLAKSVESKRAAQASPWYYPASQDRGNEADDVFADELRQCRNYPGTRLRDRYALQAVRCLFALRRYDECLEYYRREFDSVPDSNLFKRMACGYAGGCWYRLGDTDKANQCFLIADDIRSLSCDDVIAYMAEHKPDSPALMRCLRSLACDSAAFCTLEPLARNLLDTGRVNNRGDWYFVLAYIAGKHRGDYAAAERYMRSAMNARFSSEDFRDHARAYALAVDGTLTRKQHLAEDLKWLEKKTDPMEAFCDHWTDILRNIVYDHFVPALWQKGDFATAILMSGFADNCINTRKRLPVWSTYDAPEIAVTLDEMRKNPDTDNLVDYSGLSFRLMESLSSDKLAAVQRQFGAHDTLTAFLRRYARTDPDYVNDIIGTLALREENYERAVSYLSKVSVEYQRCLNTYKYLARYPFLNTDYIAAGESYSAIYEAEKCRSANDADNAKLRFATRMKQLRHIREHDADPDRRALAALQYAAGRHSAATRCWALTQYHDGTPGTLFLADGEFDTATDSRYSFLFGELEADEEDYRRETEAIVASIHSDEARAQARSMLNQRIAVVRQYPRTAVAREILSRCDELRVWL